MDKQPVVYNLASGRHSTLYIGVTSDLPARLHQHREDLIKGFTSRYGVSRLVHFELFDDMISAIAREKQLKKWNRAWKIELIETRNPEWEELAGDHVRISIPSRITPPSFPRRRESTVTERLIGGRTAVHGFPLSRE